MDSGLDVSFLFYFVFWCCVFLPINFLANLHNDYAFVTIYYKFGFVALSRDDINILESNMNEEMKRADIENKTKTTIQINNPKWNAFS